MVFLQTGMIVAAALAAAAVAWLVRGRDLRALAGERDAAKAALANAEIELSAQRRTVAEAREETAAMRGRLEAAQETAADLGKAQERITALSAEAEGLRAKAQAAEAR
jgi:hypothetical protein